MSFGKIEFASAFSPLSAFPLDARTLLTKEEAEAAARSAERAGSKNTTYYYGMRINVLEEVELDDGTKEPVVVTYAITAANKLKKMSTSRYAEEMQALEDKIDAASDVANTAKNDIDTLKVDLSKKSTTTDTLFGLLKTVNNKPLIASEGDTNIDIDIPTVSDFLNNLITINNRSLKKTDDFVNLDLLTTGDLNGYAKTGDIEGTYLTKVDASTTYVAATGLEDTIKATIRGYLRTVNSNPLYKTDNASGDIVITGGSDIDNEELFNMLSNYLLSETFREFKGDHTTLDSAISSFITETDVNNILNGKGYLTELPEHSHDQYLTSIPTHTHTLSEITDYEEPVIPTKVSELENDIKYVKAIYLTTFQDMPEDMIEGVGYRDWTITDSSLIECLNDISNDVPVHITYVGPASYPETSVSFRKNSNSSITLNIDATALSSSNDNYILQNYTHYAYKYVDGVWKFDTDNSTTDSHKLNIPTKLSDLERDIYYLTYGDIDASGYVKNDDMNLAIAEAISGIEKLTKKIVDYVLIDSCEVVKNGDITQAEENVIYLVSDPVMTGPDIYIEYTIIDGKLTCIGDTSTNLEDFYTKDDINSLLDEKAAYDHTHPELHTHDNKEALDQIIINASGSDDSVLTKKGYISRSNLFDGYATVGNVNSAKSEAINDIKNFYTKDKIVEIIQAELDKYIQKIHLKTISSHKDSTLISLFNTAASTPENITFKTINGNSIIGSGDITIKAADGDGEADVKSYVELDTYTQDKQELNQKIDNKVSNVVSDSAFVIVLDDPENSSVKRISFSIDCICAGNASTLTNNLNGTGSPDEPESV